MFILSEHGAIPWRTRRCKRGQSPKVSRRQSGRTSHWVGLQVENPSGLTWEGRANWSIRKPEDRMNVPVAELAGSARRDTLLMWRLMAKTSLGKPFAASRGFRFFGTGIENL